MAKLSVEERLDVAIKRAASDADPSYSSRQVAQDLFDTDTKLIEHFSRDWIVEKLASLIRMHRAKKAKADDPQMLLGFTVPKKITLKTGERKLFGEVTLWQLRQARALVWKDKRKRKHPTLLKLDQAIDLMKPYSTSKRGTTYAEALALEAEKVRAEQANKE